MASTFDIGGSPRSKKNLVSDCPGGGGVHGNPIWPMDYMICGHLEASLKLTKNTDFESKLLSSPSILATQMSRRYDPGASR